MFGSNNTYSTSTVRSYLKGLETYGSSNAYGITSDPGYIASYTDTNETNGTVDGDKFWLLSETQANTFFADNESRVFYNDDASGVDWTLRTPGAFDTTNARAVGIEGSVVWFRACDLASSFAVRAAFQLA